MTGPAHWWWAVEPFGDAVAWSLTRVEPGVEPEGPVAAGLLPDVAAVRATAATARPGERGDPWTGPLTEPGAERVLATTLGEALLPGPLRDALAAGDRERPDTVTIAVRGWAAALPWDCLAIDRSGTRLLEVANVRGGLPATVHAGRARLPGGRVGPALRIVDPGPETAAGSAGPAWRLLYPQGRPRAWDDRLAADEVVEPVVGGDGLTVPDLAALLAERPARLLYLGHAVAGTGAAPAAAGLVLTDDAGDAHLFRAFDWLAAPDRFPSPHRVALIGCGSDDSEVPEQSGLPIAAVNAGAELVTATRWVLPLDRGPDLTATTDLALAVDRAHGAPQPLRELRDWQLQRLDRWRDGGRLTDSPLVWGSLVSYLAPGRR